MAVVGHLSDAARAGNRADLRGLGSVLGFHGAGADESRPDEETSTGEGAEAAGASIKALARPQMRLI
jgi:hypothetical protein